MSAHRSSGTTPVATGRTSRLQEQLPKAGKTAGEQPARRRPSRSSTRTIGAAAGPAPPRVEHQRAECAAALLGGSRRLLRLPAGPRPL
eukprot:962250-Prymnesium_polylepis.2